MKSILLVAAFLLSLPVLAQSVYLNPTLFVNGNSVMVQINNHTDSNVNCSGTVMMQTYLGRTETGFYSSFIPKKSFSTRSVYLYSMSDRITFANHFINCYKAL